MSSLLPLVQKLINAGIGAVVVGALAGLLGYFGFPILGDLSSIDAEKIAALAGVVLAFGLQKIPFLATWFRGLEPSSKGWATAGSNIGLGTALFVLSCAGQLGESVAIACTASGALGLAALVLSSLVANQATYLALVKPQARVGGAQR